MGVFIRLWKLETSNVFILMYGLLFRFLLWALLSERNLRDNDFDSVTGFESTYEPKPIIARLVKFLKYTFRAALKIYG